MVLNRLTSLLRYAGMALWSILLDSRGTDPRAPSAADSSPAAPLRPAALGSGDALALRGRAPRRGLSGRAGGPSGHLRDEPPVVPGHPRRVRRASGRYPVHRQAHAPQGSLPRLVHVLDGDGLRRPQQQHQGRELPRPPPPTACGAASRSSPTPRGPAHATAASSPSRKGPSSSRSRPACPSYPSPSRARCGACPRTSGPSDRASCGWHGHANRHRGNADGPARRAGAARARGRARTARLARERRPRRPRTPRAAASAPPAEPGRRPASRAPPTAGVDGPHRPPSRPRRRRSGSRGPLNIRAGEAWRWER